MGFINKVRNKVGMCAIYIFLVSIAHTTNTDAVMIGEAHVSSSGGHMENINIDETARQLSGAQRLVGAESDDWSLALRSVSDCKCPGGKEYLFEVRNKKSGRETEYRLSNRTASVEKIFVGDNNKAVVIGSSDLATTGIVNVIDLERNVLIDWFLGLRIATSPGNRYIAYVKVFPAHGFPGVSYEYLIYDLSQTPSVNRTSVNKHNKLWDPDESDYGPGYDPYDVGWPLYPADVDNHNGDNLFDERHMSAVHLIGSSGLFWLDESTLGFADRYHGQQRVVIADLINGDITKPDISIKALDDLGIIDLTSCGEMQQTKNGTSDEMRNRFNVTLINLLGKGVDGYYVRIYLSAASCLRYHEMEIVVPHSS